MNHDLVEKNIGMMVVFIVIVISFGGLAELIPIFNDESVTSPIPGMRPLTALELEGRNVYQREGCIGCHSQMIRPLRAETERYGHYSLAGESAFDHPFLWGSKRTGPDLARVGGRYSDEWHRAHLMNPRDLVPESNMPSFPWLADNVLSGEDTGAHMAALRTVGVPYTDEMIAGAKDAVAGKTEMQAMIAYLQQLGTHLNAGGR